MIKEQDSSHFIYLLFSLSRNPFFFQIVSLGAGFDTLFFSLADEGLLKDTKYFEVKLLVYLNLFQKSPPFKRAALLY